MLVLCHMIEVKKLEAEQRALAKNISVKDIFSFDHVATVGGVSQSFSNATVISAIVVCDFKTLKIIEKKYATAPVSMPYISGFRVYREGRAISEAYSQLSKRPDVLIFYGNGILHPRKIGLASHMGLLLNQPSVGVAKELACGTVKDEKVFLGNDVVGQVVITRKYAKPLYISPGFNISQKTSVAVVKACMRPPHKFPEPLHLAYRYAKELARNLKRDT